MLPEHSVPTFIWDMTMDMVNICLAVSGVLCKLPSMRKGTGLLIFYPSTYQCLVDSRRYTGVY